MNFSSFSKNASATDISTSGSKHLPVHGAIRTLHRRRRIQTAAPKDLCVWSGPQIPTALVPLYPTSHDSINSTTTDQDMRPPPHSAPASFFGVGAGFTGYAGRVQAELEHLRAMGREQRERGSWKAHCAAQMQSRDRDVFGGERRSRRWSAGSGPRPALADHANSRSPSPASWPGSSSSSSSGSSLHVPDTPARSRKFSWSSLHSHSHSPSSSATAFSADFCGPSVWLHFYIQENLPSEPEYVTPRAAPFTPPSRCHSAPPILACSNVVLPSHTPSPLPIPRPDYDGYQYHAPRYSAVDLQAFDSEDEEFMVEMEEEDVLSPTTHEHRLLVRTGPATGEGQGDGEERRPLVRFGQEHIDVLFITTEATAQDEEVELEGQGTGEAEGKINCRICLRQLGENPGCPEARRAVMLGTFPGDAPWDELFDHCSFKHPVELGRVARMSVEDLARRRFVGV
ncbi:hypothetical protein H0H81_004312 [Sphagnurus paluster]|uniref:Uncharacterized protein n=1 Tax=Sphagnurus paluster TaxID=117069 RepID=A0A9P7GTF6_9AGAR|nr:hypothetical protein H0H81_004312 [Sphagnurus paluster]